MTDGAHPGIAAQRARAFFERIAPADVARLDAIYADDAFFQDPFSAVAGISAIRDVYARMFDTLDDVRFRIVDVVADGSGAMLTWDMTYRVKRWRPHEVQRIHGASHLRFAPDGRIAYHRDYWDAANELYAKLPVVGALMRFLKRRLG